MKILPQAVVAFLIIIFITLLELNTFTETLSGFSQPFIWLLVATYVLASGIEQTGVGRRIALKLLVRAKGKSDRTILYILITGIIIGFIIPTSSGRAAMLMPVCVGLIQVMSKDGLYENFGKNVMLGTAFVANFLAWGLITGSSSSIYAVSYLKSTIDYEWSYIYWFSLNYPMMIIATFLLWLTMKKMFPLHHTENNTGYTYIQAELNKLDKLKSEEWRIIIIGLLTLIGWITEPIHGLSVSLVALITAVISCIPSIGVQSWGNASKRVDWDVIVLFGAGYALANTLQQNGTAVWLATNITTTVPDIHPFGAALLMILIISFIRLGFANMLAITATFLPITISLAEIWDINPIWLVQVVIIACSFGHFLPVQSPPNLITYSYGYYQEKDLLKLGGIVTLQVILLLLVTSFFIWPLFGLKP